MPAATPTPPISLGSDWQVVASDQLIQTRTNVVHKLNLPPARELSIRFSSPWQGPIPDEITVLQSGIERRYSMQATAGIPNATAIQRLISLRSGNTPGELLTKPLVFNGGELLLSLSTSGGGGARVEIQNSKGIPAPGFSLADCQPVTGDTSQHAVQWQGSSDIKSLAGETVRLRIVLRNTDLSSFCIRDPEWRRAYPPPVRDIAFRSSRDGSLQHALFYHPGGDQPVPLLVALHTWSGDYTQTYHREFGLWCVENNWAFLHPDFRGPNRNPQACGSELAVADIKDAVAWAQAQNKISPSQIYLAGTSGGGHMALLMAGRAPQLWAGVSAWVGIADLRDWYRESLVSGRSYANDIANCCGGAPGATPEVEMEYSTRSPLAHLDEAAQAGVPVDINAGIRDGHDGSVPISHSLHAFNALAQPADRLSEESIQYMVQHAEVPASLRQIDLVDPAYGDKQPLFRRTSGPVRVTLFDGGHELIPKAALHWLSEKQRRAR